MNEGKKCELCKEKDPTTLCSECYKCYCDECSEFIHKLTYFKDHKVEAIAEGIIVNATCPLHENNPLELFCVDEVKLCCPMCDRKNLHEKHKLVEIPEIQKDNEIFSARKARELFEDFRNQVNELGKKTESVMEELENEVSDVQGKIKKTFEEEHKKLEEEENKVIDELEEIKNKNVVPLANYLNNLSKVLEYSNFLSKESEIVTNKGKCSRLIELNIVSEMEKQRKELELLCKEEMYGLRFVWDDKKRKLSCVKKLFNGAPVPRNVTFPNILCREVEIKWECDVNKVREEDSDKISFVVDMAKNDKEEWKEVYSGNEMKCVVKGLETGTEYAVRVRCVVDGSMGKWSEKRDAKTKEVETYKSEWKKCPDDVDEKRKYFIDKDIPRIAINNNNNGCSTVIGNTLIPNNKVTSWNIKLLNSEKNDGNSIYIGIAPFDINQNEDGNYKKCGWYYHCYTSTLYSGPPHNYNCKGYGPRKRVGRGYFHTGGTIGVIIDITKGELSFFLNGVNLGIAYEGIPLDKPLVPCAVLKCKGDSVELDTSEVKENVDNSIPVLSNVTIKNATWDSITLIWDKVDGISFYQVEVDGRKLWGATTTSSFTKRGLLPETEHNFKIRIVKINNSVSEWSDVVKGRTLETLDFKDCAWKECPDDVFEGMKYSVDDDNHRNATKISDNDDDGHFCTIIGNAPLPSNKVSSWNIKITKSKKENGYGTYIGVAPSDINQNRTDNYKECGWYFNCYCSTLYSGPPHNYYCKEYGPRKERGEYVHTGDSVGVVMDSIKGELSFVVDGVNYGVAYEEIPLDKPLVLCVILRFKGDSIELDTSEVKEIVDSSISVPSNITIKNITWDSITLTWDKIEDASFYQIEVDGSKKWDSSTTNTFAKRGFLSESEHNFRVRIVKKRSVGKWSDVVKGKTIKAHNFSECVWRECPDYVEWKKKYSVDGNNPRIATLTNDIYCIIIGNTFLPSNKITSWNIKILKSKNNDGYGIYIGISPFDINQNEDNNYKYGWYFGCWVSTLCSGLLHNYRYKEYGPRKEYGKYVHTGNIVGVVMNTIKSELSFVVNGVNFGVAYEGIPLDKPLVPCVLLGIKGDSVELII